MKKWIALVLSLLLCITALAPFAAAEEAYVPGAIAEKLITDSFNAGQIITGHMKLRLDADAAAFGLEEEEAAIFNALLPVLDDITVGLGAGKTESGIRIEADAELANAHGGDPVTVSAAANLDLYGISVESDLIPGERVTSKWETLLAMAGMNDSDIGMLVMLRDIDWEVMLPQYIAIAESYLNMGLQYAQPYGEIVLGWAAALPMTLEEGPAPEGCPEGAAVSSVTVTEKDMMELAAALAEYLKADTVVAGFANLLIQEAYTGEGNPPTAQQLCDEVIAAASSVTNTEDCVKLTWGVDESGMPVYGSVQLIAAESGVIRLALSCVPNAANNNDYTFAFDIVNPDGTPYLSMHCAGEIGANTFTANAELLEEGAQIMGLQYSVIPAPVEGTLPSQKIEQTMSMVVDDGTTSMQLVGSGTVTCTATIDGGEEIDESMNTDMYVDGVQVTTTALETLTVYPDTDGFVGTYSVLQSMPQMGINAVGLDVHLGDHPYDPAAAAALRETALETSSKTDIDGLIATVMQNGQFKLIAAMQALPTEVLSLLMNAE